MGVVQDNMKQVAITTHSDVGDNNNNNNDHNMITLPFTIDDNLDILDSELDVLITNNELYFHSSDTYCETYDLYIVCISLVLLAYFVLNNIVFLQIKS